MTPILTLILLSIASPAFAAVYEFPDTADDDPRLVRSAASPAWLEAVGKLVAKKGPGEAEACSLSLVADHPAKDGVIVVGAAHCISHWRSGSGDYDPGAHNITWTSNVGVKIERTIARVFKSEMIPADYFIARLNAPVSKSTIRPLLNAPYDYSDLMDEEMFGVDGGGPFDPFATMAGFSADTGLGRRGAVMTYHEGCRLNGGGRGLKKAYCYSYVGASGGPVVVTVALDELADEEWQEGRQSYFVGSIVGSRLGDDNSRTMFTSTTYYTKTLDPILAAH